MRERVPARAVSISAFSARTECVVCWWCCVRPNFPVCACSCACVCVCDFYVSGTAKVMPQVGRACGRACPDEKRERERGDVKVKRRNRTCAPHYFYFGRTAFMAVAAAPLLRRSTCMLYIYHNVCVCVFEPKWASFLLRAPHYKSPPLSLNVNGVILRSAHAHAPRTFMAAANVVSGAGRHSKCRRRRRRRRHRWLMARLKARFYDRVCYFYCVAVAGQSETELMKKTSSWAGT